MQKAGIIIDTKYIKKLNDQLAKIGQKFSTINEQFIPETGKMLLYWGNKLRNECIQSMKSSPPSGHFSVIGGKKHFSSRPGHPPRIASGELIRSLLFDVSNSPLQLEFGVIAGAVPYAKVLEFGNKSSYTIKVKTKKVLSDGINIFGKQVIHPKMPARPFIKPLGEKHGQEIVDDVGKMGQNILANILQGVTMK